MISQNNTVTAACEYIKWLWEEACGQGFAGDAFVTITTDEVLKFL